jgi:hypothetical protein
MTKRMWFIVAGTIAMAACGSNDLGCDSTGSRRHLGSPRLASSPQVPTLVVTVSHWGPIKAITTVASSSALPIAGGGMVAPFDTRDIHEHIGVTKLVRQAVTQANGVFAGIGASV